MPVQVAYNASSELAELMRLERQAFAAKIRMTRALLGWSQTELASRVGLTQRSVHKLEQGDTEPRRATFRMIEQLWLNQGIELEDLADGGFRVRVRPELFGSRADPACDATAQACTSGISSDH